MSPNVTLVLIFSMCILAPSGVIAAAVYASINALGRNPSAAPKIFTAMTLTMVFAEALAIIGLLITFQVYQP